MHECSFTRTEWREGEGVQHGDWVVTDHYKVKVCREDGCNEEQPTRAGTRPIEFQERRCIGQAVAVTHNALAMAQACLAWYDSRQTDLVTKTYLRRTVKRDLVEVATNLAESGLAVIRHEPGVLDERSFLGLRCPDVAALEELVHPGRRADVEAALTAIPSDAEFAAIRQWAQAQQRPDPDAIMTAVSFVKGLPQAEGLGIRAFSAIATGDSKQFQRHAAVLQRLYPDEAHRFRDTTLEWFGGQGVVQGVEIDATIRALPQADLREINITYPTGGVIIVENKECFEVASRGLIPELRDCLVVWSGGQPSHITHLVVKDANNQGHRVRAWMDLDGEGIGMVRGLRRYGDVEAFGMSLTDFDDAPVRKVLAGQKLTTVRKAMEVEDEFAAVLECMLAESAWVEQETQLPCFLQRPVNKVARPE